MVTQHARKRRSLVQQRNGGGELLWRHEYGSLTSRTNSLPATAALLQQCSSRDSVHLEAKGRICSGPTSATSLPVSCRVSTAPSRLLFKEPHTLDRSIFRGSTALTAAATAIRSALNSNLPVEAVTAGSSITPVSVSFSGSLNGYYLQVTSVSSGSIELGAQISGPGIAAGSLIINQLDGTPGDAGLYSLFIVGGTTSSETMTESYGVLTVGSVTSGAVAVGEEVTGAGVLPLTAIDDNLSGSGPGSTWLVNNAQTVAGENMTMNATPLTVTLESDVGATENNDYFKISTEWRLRLRSQSIDLELHERHGGGRVGSDASVWSHQFNAGRRDCRRRRRS